MPKDKINYSNTIIYKIFCKNKCINDIYIGHTTNFTKRKYQHKCACNNETLKSDLKIYKTIRANGGWDNWDMIEIAKYNCNDANEARIKEQEYINLLNPSLNIVQSKFIYEKNISCDNLSECNNNLNSSNHTFNNTINVENDSINNLLINITTLSCDKCNKTFHSHSGLWKHKKKCSEQTNKQYIEEKAKSITDKDELIMFLIKECSDYKNLLIEQQGMMMKVIENGVGNNSHNNNCNNNNKTFNLQVFLNETCKDAINITDFIDSIKLQLSDIEKIGEIGYVDGISSIITSNLKALDVTQRPVHCTDKKRETVYIKDENQWTKEDDNKSKLRKVIQSVFNKNIKLLPQFREKYPEYKNSSSKISDKYDKMVLEVMTSDTDKDDKIIRNISNATTIDKLIKEK
jgi:hypothetical protein